MTITILGIIGFLLGIASGVVNMLKRKPRLRAVEDDEEELMEPLVPLTGAELKAMERWFRDDSESLNP